MASTMCRGRLIVVSYVATHARWTPVRAFDVTELSTKEDVCHSGVNRNPYY